MDAQVLRDFLSGLLANQIGVFIKSDKSEIPSLWLKGSLVPEHYQCRGLQVIIYTEPDENRCNVTGGRVDHRWFKIELTQFDRSQSTEEAFALIKASFPIVRSQLFEKSRDLPETRIVLIYDPVFVEILN